MGPFMPTRPDIRNIQAKGADQPKLKPANPAINAQLPGLAVSAATSAVGGPMGTGTLASGAVNKALSFVNPKYTAGFSGDTNKQNLMQQGVLNPNLPKNTDSFQQGYDNYILNQHNTGSWLGQLANASSSPFDAARAVFSKSKNMEDLLARHERVNQGQDQYTNNYANGQINKAIANVDRKDMQSYYGDVLDSQINNANQT